MDGVSPYRIAEKDCICASAVEHPPMIRILAFTVLSTTLVLFCQHARAAEPDLILHHGKIVTVDPKFSVQQAIAVKDGRILQVGADEEVLRTKGPATQMI